MTDLDAVVVVVMMVMAKLVVRRGLLPVEPAAQQDDRRAEQNDQDTERLFQRQFLVEEENADKAADDGHQQQVQLDDPDFIMLEIAVIEEINAGLRKAAEQHEPPEAVDRFDGREVQVARKGRGRAEEDEHNKVVVT